MVEKIYWHGPCYLVQFKIKPKNFREYVIPFFILCIRLGRKAVWPEVAHFGLCSLLYFDFCRWLLRQHRGQLHSTACIVNNVKNCELIWLRTNYHSVPFMCLSVSMLYSLPRAEVLSGKNVREWISMVLYSTLVIL